MSSREKTESVEVERLQSVTSNVSSRTNDSSLSGKENWDFEKFGQLDEDANYLEDSDASENIGSGGS